MISWNSDKRAFLVFANIFLTNYDMSTISSKNNEYLIDDRRVIHWCFKILNSYVRFGTILNSIPNEKITIEISTILDHFN